MLYIVYISSLGQLCTVYYKQHPCLFSLFLTLKPFQFCFIPSCLVNSFATSFSPIATSSIAPFYYLLKRWIFMSILPSCYCSLSSLIIVNPLVSFSSTLVLIIQSTNENVYVSVLCLLYCGLTAEC